MTTIEIIAIIIAVIISLPRLCNSIRRPSLLYCSYLVVGVILSEHLTMYSHFMLNEVGKIGFTLLLFLIGLEIELPSWKAIKKSISFCILWLGIQIPAVMIIFNLFGFGSGFGWIAATAINACSLSIAYGLLKTQKNILNQSSNAQLLAFMMTLEVFSLFIFAGSDVVFKYGWGREILTEGAGLLGFIFIIKLFSKPIHHGLSLLIEGKGKWRIHQLLLVIFLVAIVGERLGLSAPKTAFFLGLFMTAITNRGLRIEDALKPLSKGILIPVFFISLGSHISIVNFLDLMLPIGIVLLATLIIRYYIFRRFFETELPQKTFFLLYPNITMASVAAEILIQNHYSQNQIDLLLLSSFILTVGSALLFPTPIKKESLPPKQLLEPSLASSKTLIATTNLRDHAIK